MYFKKISTGCVLAILMMLLSCAGIQKPAELTGPAPFEESIQYMGNHLSYQILSDMSQLEESQIRIVLEPFTDSKSGEIPRVSMQIEKILIETAAKNYPQLQLERMTSSNIDAARYIIEGNIQLDDYAQGDTTKKIFRVSAAVKQLEKNIIVGRSEVWISETNLDVSPLAIYSDSPLFDTRMTVSSKEQIDKMKVRALLSDAKTAYETGDYQKALDLFTQAHQLTDKPGIIIYTGLYLANSKLGRTEPAEKAFQQMLSVSIRDYKLLTLKFLFEVNSVRFIEAMKEEYQMWLKQVGTFFTNSDYCIVIEGHSSCTGSESWNKELSLERAKSIQKQMQPAFPNVFKRSSVVGKGSSQNIVGACTDDQKDSLDRRVEIKIVDCK